MSNPTREEQVKRALNSKNIKKASKWTLKNSGQEYNEDNYLRSCGNMLKCVQNFKIGNEE